MTNCDAPLGYAHVSPGELHLRVSAKHCWCAIGVSRTATVDEVLHVSYRIAARVA